MDVAPRLNMPLWRRASIIAEGAFIPNEDMAIELGLEGVSGVDDGDGEGFGALGTGLSSGVRAISESEMVSLPSREAVGVNGGVEVTTLFFCTGCSGVDGSWYCFDLASDFG